MRLDAGGETRVHGHQMVAKPVRKTVHIGTGHALVALLYTHRQMGQIGQDARMRGFMLCGGRNRITSYNVCYTKLLRHNNLLSDVACEALIGLIHAGLGDCPQAAGAAIHRLLSRYPVFAPPERPVENPSGYIVHTVHAVIQSLTHQDDFEAALIDVVNRGGDADTTGAIVGMIMGARVGVDGIPRRWLDALDPHTHQACRMQAIRLLACASVN